MFSILLNPPLKCEPYLHAPCASESAPASRLWWRLPPRTNAYLGHNEESLPLCVRVRVSSTARFLAFLCWHFDSNFQTFKRLRFYACYRSIIRGIMSSCSTCMAHLHIEASSLDCIISARHLHSSSSVVRALHTRVLVISCCFLLSCARAGWCAGWCAGWQLALAGLCARRLNGSRTKNRGRWSWFPWVSSRCLFGSLRFCFILQLLGVPYYSLCR